MANDVNGYFKYKDKKGNITNLFPVTKQENIQGLSETFATLSTVSALAGTVDKKVDKISGKSLSSNDYTTIEKNKLASIAENANKYVLPTASTTVLGGVKIGNNITSNNGVIDLTKDNITSALGYTPPETDAINTTINRAVLKNAEEISVERARIDQIIGSVPAGSADEVADARVMTDGTTAPNLGTAIRTQNADLKQNIIQLKQKMYQYRIPNDFRVGGIYASNGGLDDTATTRARTFVRYMRVGTDISANYGYDFMLFKYNSNVDGQSSTSVYKAAYNSKISIAWEQHRTINEDGYYLILGRCSDDSKIIAISGHALSMNDNIVCTYNTAFNTKFTVNMGSQIPVDWVIPYAAATTVTVDDNDITYLYFNTYGNRASTPVFNLEIGTKIIMPDGWQMIYRNVTSDYVFIDSVEWCTECETTSTSVQLMFRKSDNSDFTVDELNAMLPNVQFIEHTEKTLQDLLEKEISLIDSINNFEQKFYSYTIPNDFRIGGLYASSGSLDDSTAIRGRTFVRYMRKSTKITSDNGYMFIIHEFDKHVESQSASKIYEAAYKGQISTKWENDVEIDHDGFYMIVGRNGTNTEIELTGEHAALLCENIKCTYTVANTARFAYNMSPKLPLNYIIPWAAATSYTDADSNRHLLFNSYKARASTPVFSIAENTKIILPPGWAMIYRNTTPDNILINSSEWCTQYTSDSTCINLLFKKTDDSEISWEDLEELCKGIEFKEISAGEFSGDSTIINILDYGAVGDGIVDDSSAIQAAINLTKNIGGTVKFPVGTYKINTMLQFYSNSILDFEKGATLLRGASIKAIIRTTADITTTGYNGVHDVVIRNATFDCGTGISQGGCPLALRHSKNIRIENCTFKHQNSGYHSIECNSSYNVLIDGCRFGDLLTNTEYAECIQIDEAGTLAEYPFDNEEGAETNDGTICENIEIRSCRFSLNQYSPALGNHNKNTHKKILFHDNIIMNCRSSRGCINFDEGTDHVRIYNNVFEDCTYVAEFKNNSFKNVIFNNAFINVTNPKLSENGTWRDNN